MIFKQILAFIASGVCFLLGICVGVLWAYLYSEPTSPNIIDPIQILADQISPALVSVFFAHSAFNFIYPKSKSKYMAKNINYLLMIIFYLLTIPNFISMQTYSGFIYTATGLIFAGYFLWSNITKGNEEVKSNG